MEFNGWGVAAIIALALGIIISNLMLLRHSAKMKWPKREDLVDPVKKAKQTKEPTNESEKPE